MSAVSFIAGFVVSAVAVAATGVVVKRVKKVNLLDALDSKIPGGVKVVAVSTDGKASTVAAAGDTTTKS